MTDIKQIAEDYRAQGWQVVPLVKGEKRASSSWQKKTYEPNDFKDGDGIAGKCGQPSGWRVDVDLDSAEAIEAAPIILKTTGLIHGRPGKPTSHYWYHCEGARTAQFTDIKNTSGQKAMLVEIRSTGGYTALPPSLHPSGEEIAWSAEGVPADDTPDRLYEAVRDVAIIALLARHWPGPGGRHAVAGPLAGFLLHAKLDPREVLTIIETAARIAKDPDVHDRIAFAQSTIDKFKDGEKVTGGPRLEEAFSQEVVARMRSWLKLEDIDAIEGMNQKHFFVRMGTSSVIGREDDPDAVVFQKARELYVEYAGHKIVVGEDKKGNPEIKPLFQAWLESPPGIRRSYSKVVFAPPPLTARAGEYDLWKGFAVEPNREAFLTGKCLRMLNHTRRVICDNDPERYEYLMNLLARTARFPGEPLGVSIVMRSAGGSGKGVFVDFIGALFHPHHYSHLTKMDQAIGRFNKAILGKIIIFLDEAAAEDAMRNHGTFKSLVTDKTIQIELKGVDGDSVPNLAHIFVATNNERSVPTDEGDRRFFFLKVSDRYAFARCPAAERKAYFDPLFAELQDTDALGAFLYFLQHRDISEFDRFDKVITDEEREQRRKSLRGPMRWLFDVLALGEMPGVLAVGAESAVGPIYEAYVAWSQRHGEPPVGAGPWGKVVAKYLWIDGQTRNTKRNGKDTRVGVLVSLEELRKRLPPSSDFQAEEITEIRVRPDGTHFEVIRVLATGDSSDD